MLKNYATIALRMLKRHRGYAILNIAGLSVGMACCLLILLFVRDELRYDRFHERADRIYRIVGSTSGDGQPTNANGSFVAGPTLAAEYPEVEHAVRFRMMGWGEKRVVAHGDRRFNEAGFFFADSTVFDLFTFPFLAGNPKTALYGPHKVVITRRTAEKYFPGENPLGQMLSIDAYNDGRFTDYQVTGVIEDVPSYSHIKFDFLASWASQTDIADKGWWLEPVYTYVLLAPGASAARLNAELPAFIERHAGPDHWLQIRLQPLTDIHLHSNLRAEPEANGNIAFVYLFSAIAVFVLIIACINFMNLATAQSARRAREVGMRKVLGAQRMQLIRQFLGEAILFSLISVVFAFLLCELFLPVLNAISGKDLVLRELSNLPLLTAAIVLALVVGVFAGSYPALFLSRFQTVDVLKGHTSAGQSRAATLRKGLVVFQFTISAALIVCTAVVYQQMQHLRNLNLGFHKEQIVVLPLNDEIRERYLQFKEALMRNPRVSEATASEQVPGRAGNGGGYVVEGIEEAQSSTRLFVNHDFNRAYGTEIVAGRDFSEAHPTDARQAYVVNEAFVQSVGWASPEDAVGKTMQLQGWDERPEGEVVGVVKNFQLYSVREAIYPVVLNVMPLEYLNFLSVRVAPAEVSETLGYLESTWASFSPNYPFDYYFLDEDFERLHRADQRLGQVFAAFAVVAILVACLGLFGLAAFTAERRTKEIGVRKVLGATVPSLMALLSKDFLKLVLVAIIIAAPLAYFAMSRWLQGFAYRIEIGPGIIALTAAIALLIALATVSYQAAKAALADPVKALRYE